jgi:hypothetical protein
MLYTGNTSTPGTAMTTTIMNAGTVSNVCTVGSSCNWSSIGGGGSGTLTVGAYQFPFDAGCTNLGAVSLNSGGATYAPHTLDYNNYAIADSSTNYGITMTFSATTYTKPTALYCINLGPSESTTGDDFDRLQIQAITGADVISQFSFKACNGATSGVRIEGYQPSFVTTHSYCIPLTPQGTYWISLHADWSGTNGNGTAQLQVFNSQGTPLPCLVDTDSDLGTTTCNADGSVTLSGLMAATHLAQINFGNLEGGSSPLGTTTYYQDLMMCLVGSCPTEMFWSNSALSAGVIAPGRTIDYTGAGVVGGVPSASWTQCGSTVAACGTSGSPVSPSTCGITAAISACGTNQYVSLGSGTFYLNDAINLTKSNVAIRGQGANSTFIVTSGATNSCLGIPAIFCVSSTDSNYKGAMSNGPIAWTATDYLPGQTVITLASTPTNLVIGNPIILDQLNNTNDNGGPLVAQNTATATGSVGPGTNGPYSVDGNNVEGTPCSSATSDASCYNQEQQVTVTGINGNTLTISPGLHMPNWSASLSPRAWWATHPVLNSGVENLSVDGTSLTLANAVNIEFFNAQNSWVSGVRSLWPSRSHVQLQYANHITAQNMYRFNTQAQAVGSYGFESYVGSDSLNVNNIDQAVATPRITNAATGNVDAYNFSTNQFFTGVSLYNNPALGDHAAGTNMLLSEGNITDGMTADAIHGTQNFGTYFRNYFPGPSPSCWQSSSNSSTPQLKYSTATYGACTNNYQAMNLYAYNRGYNVIGNILGLTGTNSTNYETCSSVATIFYMGCGNSTVPSDTQVLATTMIWGNVDAFHGFTSPQFNASEVPTGLVGNGKYVPQIVFQPQLPASNTLPASFLYSSKPSWWPALKAWPIVGPDVTGGNVSGVNGTVYTNPAEDCYLNVMGGAANGEGPVLSFNANLCYGGSILPTPAPASFFASGKFNSTGQVGEK